MTETKEYSAMLYGLAEQIRSKKRGVFVSPDRIEQAAERLDTLTVTIRGLEIMIKNLQTNFKRSISKVEAATRAHPMAVSTLMEEAIEIFSEAMLVKIEEDDAAAEEELYL